MGTYTINDLDGKILHRGEAQSLVAFIEQHKQNLSEANLRFANLRFANLSEANLSDANLSGAHVTGVMWPPPPMVLLAHWGVVSGSLCVELMRYNAANHPNPEKFGVWAQGGGCPYNNVNVQRSAHFVEDRNLWSPGPSKSAYELMKLVLEEKCETE